MERRIDPFPRRTPKFEFLSARDCAPRGRNSLAGLLACRKMASFVLPSVVRRDSAAALKKMLEHLTRLPVRLNDGPLLYGTANFIESEG
jgi:hypothetical protein